ncbi:MAG TPA: hypothetical protein VHS33_06975 [Sphingomicrobium sp.]|jgi:hypothetical protein|nr:hypothetical protein [Sphingomicrobium sp.]
MAKERVASDWAGSWQGLALIWGIPAAAMAASAILVPGLRGIVWTVMLLFMGGACLANARRCNRTHCRYTGPFLILMAALVALYALGLVPLGASAWGPLATIAFGGSAILCCLSESILGRYQR